MKVAVLGAGGREHALVWALKKSQRLDKIYALPGNLGTELAGAESVPIAVDDLEAVVNFAKEQKLDLVVPGPELPLTLGISDQLRKAGLACFGPDQYAARLEGSKAFAKEIMARAKVPTARHFVVHNLAEAKEALAELGLPVVVKADGLCAGKGVVVCHSQALALDTLKDMLEKKIFGQASATVVLEECLVGEEVSLLCFSDGHNVVPLDSAQDHKAAFDFDQGPNTGGMGAYSPAPILPKEKLDDYVKSTVAPVIKVLAEDGHPFVGVIYAGLMVTAKGPKVLEYNVRFGDPECQALLPRLDSDLLTVILACLHGQLTKELVRFLPKSSLGVVVAAEGYPGAYAKDLPLEGLALLEEAGLLVFHSGTTRAKDGQVVSKGGRIICVTALADDLAACRDQVYAGLSKVKFPKTFYRKDIGAKGLKRLQA